MPDLLTLEEKPKRKLRKRRDSFHIDRDDLVQRVIRQIDEAVNERSEWNEKRLLRYAKLRGWTERENPPWDEASNVNIGIMMANSLRVKAGLFNAVLGIRPVMTPKVTDKADRERAEKANHLIDYQIFTEGDGEQLIDKYISDFVDEGTAIAFVGWSKESKLRHDVRVFPTPDIPLIEFMAETIPGIILPGAEEVVAQNDDGTSWTATVTNPDGEQIDVSLEVYDRDERRIEVVLEWTGPSFDGPTITVHDLEDVVVPMRSENTQPITPRNPTGAPWATRLIRVNLDHVRRKRKDGTYDLLTDEDMEYLEGLAEGRIPQGVASNEEELRRFKDQQAGLQAQYGNSEDDQQWLTIAEWYGAWDLNGDGLDEEVIFWIAKEGEKLCRVRYLDEMYPGEPQERPLADTRFIPVRGEFYGIGLPELMEGLHDLLHILFNQNIDRGDIANQPFFFYRASSGMKPDIIRLWPGDGYPLDNPATDVHFPQMPHADQTWSFNIIGMAMQLLDRLTQIGPLQQGQVPQGKASALRNVGSIMAILQQGAALPEQILRRLFGGLSTMWHQIHKLNGRYLPRKKRYLITGKPLNEDDAYATVEDPDEIAVSVAFGFEATLLNTNKGLMAQALVGLGTAIVNPLTIQMRLVNPETIYNWAKDLIQANQLDPARYLVRPQGMPEGPRHTFEDALLIIMSGRLPEVAPAEPVDQHYQKAVDFLAGKDSIMTPEGMQVVQAMLTDVQVAIFREYFMRLQAAMRQHVQAQMLTDAAAKFSASLGNQGQGAKEALTMGEAPEMQTEMASMDEVQGADARA